VSVSRFLGSIEGLTELHQRLSKVLIMNRDGIDIIKKWKDNPDVLFYCDPPYEQETRSNIRYRVDMNKNTQIEFLETVQNAKAKIVISGYNCPLYQDKLANWKRTDIQVNSASAYGNVSSTNSESLWINWGEDNYLELY